MKDRVWKFHIDIGTLLLLIAMLGHLFMGTEASMTDLCICILIAGANKGGLT